jgi:hypothetical protein
VYVCVKDIAAVGRGMSGPGKGEIERGANNRSRFGQVEGLNAGFGGFGGLGHVGMNHACIADVCADGHVFSLVLLCEGFTVRGFGLGEVGEESEAVR